MGIKNYSAVVTYSIKANGHNKGRLVVVHYNDIGITDEKIIQDSKHQYFKIESKGTIDLRDKSI